MTEQHVQTAADNPLISIVVPSFNHARFLPRALDSILGQDYPHIELIVADGGSTDGTVELLEDYAKRHPRLTWLSEPDNGPADAVNKGLARVSGDIIGIQSADDIYYPGAFRTVAQTFAAYPWCGFVYGDLEGIDEQDNVLYRRSFPEFSWEALFALSMNIGQSSVFFRRSAAEIVGQWDQRYYGCDLDYWMRLMFKTEALHIPRVLSGWRRYPEQRTRPEQFARIREDYWRMIEASPDVAAASRRIRRLAHASKYLLVLRMPPQSRLDTWAQVLRGACLHPGFWRYNPVRRILLLIPGMKRLQIAGRRVKRAAGLASAPRKAITPQPRISRR